METKKHKMKLFMLSWMIAWLLCAGQVLAQDPPSPPGWHGGGGNAGAPIDGGAGILLSIGAAYGVRKLYQIYRNDKKEGKSDQEE